MSKLKVIVAYLADVVYHIATVLKAKKKHTQKSLMRQGVRQNLQSQQKNPRYLSSHVGSEDTKYLWMK